MSIYSAYYCIERGAKQILYSNETDIKEIINKVIAIPPEEGELTLNKKILAELLLALEENLKEASKEIDWAMREAIEVTDFQTKFDIYDSIVYQKFYVASSKNDDIENVKMAIENDPEDTLYILYQC